MCPLNQLPTPTLHCVTPARAPDPSPHTVCPLDQFLTPSPYCVTPAPAPEPSPMLCTPALVSDPSLRCVALTIATCPQASAKHTAFCLLTSKASCSRISLKLGE